MVNIRNLAMFKKFLRLLAGRVGQLVNLSQMSTEVGVSSTTLGEWLSILEASYIVYRLTPYFGNFAKRLVKTAKFYFTDVGLAAHLLGISTAEQRSRDPLRGSLFENLVIMDAVKWYKNRDDDAQFHFLRTQTQADKRVVLVDTQALTHLACLWHAVNHEEDEELDDGEILHRINALYREASLSQVLGRWKRREDEEAAYRHQRLAGRNRPASGGLRMVQLRRGGEGQREGAARLRVHVRQRGGLGRDPRQP